MKKISLGLLVLSSVCLVGLSGMKAEAAKQYSSEEKEKILNQIKSNISNPPSWYRKPTEFQFSPVFSIQITDSIAQNNDEAADTKDEWYDYNDSIINGKFLKNATKIEIEAENFTTDSLSNIENLENMKYILMEGGAYTDLRPLKTLTKLEYLDFYAINISNLDDLIFLDNLKTLRVRVQTENDYYHISTDLSKPMALVDISSLSGKEKLLHLNIYTGGYLPTVTISKKNRSYVLQDPIVLSDQFKNKLDYKDLRSLSDEDIEDDTTTANVMEGNILSWKNIPIDAEYLAFSVKSNEDTDVSYTADEIKIPIRWVD